MAFPGPAAYHRRIPALVNDGHEVWPTMLDDEKRDALVVVGLRGLAGRGSAMRAA